MTTSTDGQATRGGGFWHRWTRSQAQVEADELKDQVHEAEDSDLTTIDRCTPGETVSVRGMVRTVTMRPRSTVPALEIELYDGSGTVSVVWLGRRRIPGIDPGRTLVVKGRLTCNTENPTIYNPRYELKPAVG
jgi:RecG-like helicase